MFRFLLLCAGAAALVAPCGAASRTAADAVSRNLAADYRVGQTDLPNDYGWCVDYGSDTTPPHLTDQRRTPGGGAFRVDVRREGAPPARTPAPDGIEVLATFPNAQSVRYEPWPGITQTTDFLVLSSHVTAQRVTLRNETDAPVTFTVTPSETVAGVGRMRRSYRKGNGFISAHRDGDRRQFATLSMPGAESSAASEAPDGFGRLLRAAGALDGSLPRETPSVTPSASFTNASDSTQAPLLPAEERGDRRWTAWNSGHDADWYQVEFNAARPVRAVTLELFVDRQGCWPPTGVSVETWNGSAFEPVEVTDADPIPDDERPMTVRFRERTTSTVRVVFTWRGNGLYGGLRSFRTDPPLPAAPGRAVMALRRTLTVAPGKSASVVATLATMPTETEVTPLSADAFAESMAATERVNASSKKLAIGDAGIDPLIHEQINLIAQTVLGAQGMAADTSFVFTRGGRRHPGWTEDHQHAHEALAYVPLAVTDPDGLRGILRTFLTQQQEDGRVPYETGTKGPRGGISTFPSLSMLTWRLYKATGDKAMLREFLPHLKAWNAWWYSNRRDEPTGLFWWGSFESTRDGANPADLRGPKVGIPGGHQGMVTADLTALMYADNRFIANIADALGEKDEAARYRARADELKKAIEFLWDEGTANYVYRARSTVQPDQRQVKIVDVGTLLPLWAGMVDGDRAERMIRAHVLNPKEMWRRNGIPSLSAAEPEYTAAPTSSHWNGQLWVQWNTLYVDALLQYGFLKEADDLARRVARMQTAMLKEHKHFFEDYSPDNLTHTNAIYDYNWGAGNIQSFTDIQTARKNNGRFSIYE